MSSSSRRSRRSPRSTKQPAQKLSSEGQLLHRDLTRLIEVQKAADIRFIPEVMDVPRLRFSAQQLFNIEASYAFTLVTSTTAATVGAIPFMLNSVNNYANYTAVFDQYRILQVNVKFVPFATGALNPTQGSGSFLYTVLDYDDANAPANQDVLLNYNTLKITPGGCIEERTLVPKFSLNAYQGSTTTGYAMAPSSMWVDSNNPGVQYYGVKYGFSSSPQAENVRVIISMAIQFKSQRTA